MKIENDALRRELANPRDWESESHALRRENDALRLALSDMSAK